MKRSPPNMQADKGLLQSIKGAPWEARAATRPGKKPAAVIIPAATPTVRDADLPKYESSEPPTTKKDAEHPARSTTPPATREAGTTDTSPTSSKSCKTDTQPDSQATYGSSGTFGPAGPADKRGTPEILQSDTKRLKVSTPPDPGTPRLEDPPSPAQTRRCSEPMVTKIEAKAKEARAVAIAVSERQKYDIVDNDNVQAWPILVNELVGDATETDLIDQHRWGEIEKLTRSDNLEVESTANHDPNGIRVNAGWAYTEGKSRLVAIVQK